MSIVVAGIMLTMSWQLSLVALVCVPLIAWSVARFMGGLHGRRQALREEQGALADPRTIVLDEATSLLDSRAADTWSGRWPVTRKGER